MYRCSRIDDDGRFLTVSSFKNSNSEKLEIKLNLYDTQEIWNWIPDQGSSRRLGSITYMTRLSQFPSFLVEKYWSLQDLREAIGKSIGNNPTATEILTDCVREDLRKIMIMAGDYQPCYVYGILRLTSYTKSRYHHFHASEIIGGMVPAAESSFHLLEKCEDDDVGCEENQCSICLDGFAAGKDLLRMPCSHVYHGGCIEKWLRRSHYCPLCRYQMPTE